MDLFQLDEGIGRSVFSIFFRTIVLVIISEVVIVSVFNFQIIIVSFVGDSIELILVQAEIERVEGQEEGVIEEG